MKPASDMNSLLPAGTVFEKYTVQKKLGQGGMGSVYLVKHNLLDALFALKTLHPEIAKENAGYVNRFIREAKLACKIRHPHLIQVHDAGKNAETGIYYIVMDYVSGGDVRSRLNKIQHFSLTETLRIIMETAGALKAAHEFGIVHRDIKPENIMFDGDGTVKLADLGIAKITDSRESALTMTSSVFGTPAYMSPEQARDSSKVDCRADIFSLGIVFYEMLSGQRPFDGKTTVEIVAKLISDEPLPDIRTIRADIPDNVAGLIADMICKDADKRIQTVAGLLDRLKKISDDLEKQFADNQSDLLQTEKKTVRMPPDQVRPAFCANGHTGSPEPVESKTVPGSAPSAKPEKTPEPPAVQPVNAPARSDRHFKGKIIITAAAAGIPVLLLLVFFFLLPTKKAAPANTGIETITIDTARQPGKTPKPVVSGTNGRTDDSPSQPKGPDAAETRIPAHSVVILGPDDPGTNDLTERLKKETKKNVVRMDFESVSRLRDQIRTVVQSQPEMVVMLPVRHFSGSGISLANFEMLFSESVEQIREKNIPLLILHEPAVSRKEKDFCATVKNVCDRRSLNFRSAAEKITLP